jgi:hypothetical protein
MGRVNLRDDKAQFKGPAIKLKKILKKIDSLEPKTIQEKDGNIIINTKKITEYILSHQNKINLAKDKIKEFYVTFPNSEWHDDAIIMLGATYLTINLKEAPFAQEAIDTYSKIIEAKNDFVIDPWTRQLLNDLHVAAIFKPIPSEDWTIDLQTSDRLKIFFSRALITEYLKDNNFEHANLVVDNFKKRDDIIGSTKNIENLITFIDAWKRKFE